MTATVSAAPATVALHLTPGQWRLLVGVSGNRPAGLPQGYDAYGAMQRFDTDWAELTNLADQHLITPNGLNAFPAEPPTRTRSFTIVPTGTGRPVTAGVIVYRSVLSSIDAPSVRRQGRPYRQLLSLDDVDPATLMFMNQANLVRCLTAGGSHDPALEDAVAKKMPDIRLKATAKGGLYTPNRGR